MRTHKNKGYRRYTRVGDTLRQVIAEAIERKVDDPRLGFVTVTKVDAAPDLKTARVLVSALGENADPAATVAALEAHAFIIQREISRHVRIMWTPKLRFFYDDTPARADHISRVLHDIDIKPSEDEDTA